jgi:pyruvate/2-oxoglutarate dehydrogenase complex dihydrolipoamide dehydrogenase (E3) component
VRGLTSTSKGRSLHRQSHNSPLPVDHKPLQFLPLDDESNQTLLANVHPVDYLNPNPSEEYDLVVLGAGVAGILSVITAKWLGKRCALVESHAMGGDCLNIGCVPSKAFIAAAKVLHQIKSASKLGIYLPIDKVRVDFAAIMTRMRKIRAEISPHDSVERYSNDFCEHVFIGTGRFLSSDEMKEMGNEEHKTIVVTGDDGAKRFLKYKKAVIATGASASIPDFLCEIPHLTNKNFFNLTELPPRLVAIGCGPVSLELSQACALFGCQVTCIENGNEILHREDSDAAQLLHQLLEQDGWFTSCSSSRSLHHLSLLLFLPLPPQLSRDHLPD